jgi:hypothetical protein
MIPRRFPLSDHRRQQLRDDKLWIRELQRARLFNLKKLHCPCSTCKGRHRFGLRTVREHLLQNGRDSEFRVWRGPGNRDSSDEEWEQEYWRPGEERPEALDQQVDTRAIIDDRFEECDDAEAVEDRVHEEVATAFAVADRIHDKSWSPELRNEPAFPDSGAKEVP